MKAVKRNSSARCKDRQEMRWTYTLDTVVFLSMMTCFVGCGGDNLFEVDEETESVDTTDVFVDDDMMSLRLEYARGGESFTITGDSSFACLQGSVLFIVDFSGDLVSTFYSINTGTNVKLEFLSSDILLSPHTIQITQPLSYMVDNPCVVNQQGPMLFSMESGEIEITRVGDVGETIEGRFSGRIALDGDTEALATTGTFAVKRVE